MPCNCKCCCGCCCDGETGAQSLEPQCEPPKVFHGKGTQCDVCCDLGEIREDIDSEESCPGEWVVNGRCQENPCGCEDGSDCPEGQTCCGGSCCEEFRYLCIDGGEVVEPGQLCEDDPERAIPDAPGLIATSWLGTTFTCGTQNQLCTDFDWFEEPYYARQYNYTRYRIVDSCDDCDGVECGPLDPSNPNWCHCASQQGVSACANPLP